MGLGGGLGGRGSSEGSAGDIALPPRVDGGDAEDVLGKMEGLRLP